MDRRGVEKVGGHGLVARSDFAADASVTNRQRPDRRERRDEEDEDASEIPPDFRLTLVGEGDETDAIDVESVILAIGLSSEIPLGFDLPGPYFFRIATNSTGDSEQDLLSGFREIVAIFAELAGRADLDLYRPRRDLKTSWRYRLFRPIRSRQHEKVMFLFCHHRLAATT